MTDDHAALAAAALAARVDALEARVQQLEARLGGWGEGTGVTATADAVDPWSVPPWPEVVGLLRQNKKIQAIKVYREHAGGGLQEAKETVEEVERRLGG